MLVPSSIGGSESKAATYIIYGCVGPVVVSIIHGSSRRSNSYDGLSQAIYPTMILFLVVLKLSPIDNGGLSQVRRVRERGVRPGRKRSIGSTIVFRHSTFHGPTAGDLGSEVMEVASQLEPGDRLDRHVHESESRESSVTSTMCMKHIKNVSTLV